MKQRRSLSNRQDLVWLSGWVFADLLLGLAVIFLAGTRGSSPIEIAALTPSPTPTIGPSPTPYPTYTPGPSPTPYPTYTPGPSPTPYPTYTPGPSPTPYPTYTPGPSPTPYPTYTPWPTQKAPVVPALSIGLDPSPYMVTLRTDPTLFLSAATGDRRASDNQFRSQVHSCLDAAAGSKMGLILGTGYNPDVTVGANLAERAMEALQNELPALFGNTIQKEYHGLSDDPYLNGMVTLEIYFIADPKVTLPKALLGAQCTPPPKTWCQGKESTQSLIVYNWDVLPFMNFVLDGIGYNVKSAKGTMSGGDDRTVGCIMVSPGRHNWSAGNASGTISVDPLKNPDPIRLCYSPAQLCPGGVGPSTPAPGVQ